MASRKSGIVAADVKSLTLKKANGPEKNCRAEAPPLLSARLSHPTYLKMALRSLYLWNGEPRLQEVASHRMGRRSK